MGNINFLKSILDIKFLIDRLLDSLVEANLEYAKRCLERVGDYIESSWWT